MKISMFKRKININDIGKDVLFPYGKFDLEDFEKIHNNSQVVINVSPGRNVKLFKKYWALCRMIAENGEKFKNQEEVSDYMKLKAGLVDYREMVTLNDEKIVRIKTKSISWESMKDDEFQNYWSMFLPIACELLDCDEKDVNENLVFYN